ncbi:hypothetical protein IDM40_19795 [Nocardiopsis sp. HNM0947]|uniref:Uncharacterized protein n=1 Tax=Nocardiopsis coralli TaxID=2772213 RepID=A0ABR9PAR2_9ACTN|nr:hypothetical protein [Nocardiopsis coralli]MBE3000917.1 hypothetical protein [Nocardiopsis coralli]
MLDDLGMEHSTSLQDAGQALGEEASQLLGNAQALFSTMEMDVRGAMNGGAPSSFMEAHGSLNTSFGSMMGWLDRMGISLADVNMSMIQVDEDNVSDFDASGSEVDGLPPINV